MDLKDIETAQGQLAALARLRLTDDATLIFDLPLSRADGSVDVQPLVVARDCHALLGPLLAHAQGLDLLALASELARLRKVLPEEISRIRAERAIRGVAHDLPSRLRQALARGRGIDDIPLLQNAADELDRLTALERMLDALVPAGEGEHRIAEKVGLLQQALVDAINLPLGQVPDSAAHLLPTREP